MPYGEEEGYIGHWSTAKLDILREYLPIYQNACMRAKHCFYVDAFAGRGEWKVKGTNEVVQGSPKIALTHLEKFTRTYFVEMDEERVKELQSLKDSSAHPFKVKVLQGDANEMLPQIFHEIHPKAPTFVFLDPSADQLKWSAIEHLSKWKTELFILYPYNMTISRYLPQDIDKLRPWGIERLNNFFGCSDWLEVYQDHAGGRRRYLAEALLRLYTGRLKQLGYDYCNVSKCFRTIDAEHGQRLYYMLWVGKHPVGKKIIDSVLKKVENSPQLDLGLDLDTF